MTDRNTDHQTSPRRSGEERPSLRRKQRQRQQFIKGIAIGLAIVALLAGLYFLLFHVIDIKRFFNKDTPVSGTPEETVSPPAEETTTEDPMAAEREEEARRTSLIEEADRLAAGYDYDGAIALLQAYEGYEDIFAMTEAIQSYEETKATMVPYAPDQVTHIFYHSLIADTSLAFDGDSRQKGYNQVMTTIDEFNKIMQSMYERGFVLVSIHDMGRIETQEDGSEKMVPGTIYLPEGKKPYVLSQDDVSYYHYMDGDGFATRIVLDQNGKPTCEYKNTDGSIVTGDYDMIPLVDRFIEEHPDASYRGAKGIIALTGYNGILGYRTDPAYQTGEGLDSYQQAWLDAHPDYNFEAECAEAKKIAEALKADGWEFASHSYGHRYYGQISEEDFHSDADKWEQTVEPLIGDTDIMIFAFGDDIGDWHPYSADNTRLQYLKSLGFDYFCNVDSTERWVQIGDNYLRQGRRNLDGKRMWEAVSGGTNRLADLFDVNAVFDPARPTPVE